MLLLWLLLPGLKLLLLRCRGDEGESNVEELRLVSLVPVEPPQAKPAKLPFDTATLSCSSRLLRFCSILRRRSSFNEELPVNELRFNVPIGDGVKVPALSPPGDARKLKAFVALLLLSVVGVAGVQDNGFTKKYELCGEAEGVCCGCCGCDCVAFALRFNACSRFSNS